MPICKLCKKRIELAYRGVRAYRCSECKSTVCKDHFEFDKKLCYKCAGLPYTELKKSFIRSGTGDEG
jgi:hypothetical protein